MPEKILCRISPRSPEANCVPFAVPLSAVMGHRLHRLRGHHPGLSLLLLHLQKMDIQEEKQKEGQRQGQKRHQHEGRRGRDQN